MVDGIGMALTSLKSASDLAKSLLDLRDAAKISEATIELNGKIAAAQQLAIAAQLEQAALIKQIDNLEKKVVQFENWEAEKQRYELVRLEPGILMYRLKSGMENSEPAHEICATCYNSGKKSYLHQTGHGNGLTFWKCHSCGFEESSGRFIQPQVNHGRDWMV